MRREDTAVPTVGQRAARAKAQAQSRPARAADPAAAAARLATYVPADPRAAEHLPLLRDLARAASPADAADAGELLGALAGHAGWLVATGVTVDAGALLDPDLVQRWCLLALADKSSGTAANYRSRLSRIAAANGTPRRKAAPLHASDPAAAYTPADEDQMLAWANGQRTDLLRRDLHTLLALGLGAGLPTGDLLAVRGTDVRTGTNGTAVIVEVRGDHPRLVPVRPRYAQLLTDLADQAAGGYMFRPGSANRTGKNTVSNVVARAARDRDPRLAVPVPQRMRATWLVRHLEAGVRVDALLAAAGLDSLAVLDRYLPALPALDQATVLDALAGGGA